MNTSSDKEQNAPAAGASDSQKKEPLATEHASRESTSAALPAYMRTANTDEPASAQSAALPEKAAPEQAVDERPDAAPAAPTPAAAPGLGEALERARQETESVIAVAPDGSAVHEHTPLAGPDPSPAGGDAFAQAHDAPRADAPSPPLAAAAEEKDDASKKKRKKTPAKQQGPASASFAQTHPILAVEQSMPPSLGSRLYNGFALLPLLPLTVLLLLQVLFSLDARHLWFPDEVRHAALFQNLLEHGKGLVLELNGAPYAEKSPLYFWLLRGLFELLRTSGPILYFSAAALCALLYLWAALGLGRLVGRVNGRTNFAAGIMVLSTSLFMGVIHYAGMDILCAALLLCAHILLYRAFTRSRRSPVLMAAAFFLSGLAALMNGPFLLAMPLLSIVLFALWRGTPERLLRPDLPFGLVAGLLTIGAWPALVLFLADKEQSGALLHLLLAAQVTAPLEQLAQPHLSWLELLRRLPFVLLPWALLLFFLPWNRLVSRATRDGLAASRRPEKEGLAFLWCMLVAALCLLPLSGAGSCGRYLPLLPPLAILAARPLLALSGTRAPALRYSFAVLFLLFGIAFILSGLMFFDILPSPSCLPQWTLEAHGGFFIAGALCLVTTGLLWLGLGSSRPEGVLLLIALAAAGLGYPIASLVAPSFDPALSPQAQARLLRAYADKGYAPAAYHVERGSYEFYAGMPVPELQALADAPAPGGGNSILALPLADWESWEDKPDSFKEVAQHWMGRTRYVLVSPAPIADLTPAPVPYADAPDIIAGLLQRIGLGGAPAPAPEQEAPAPAAETAPEQLEHSTDLAPAPTSPPQEQSPADQTPTPDPQDQAGDAQQQQAPSPAMTEEGDETATDTNDAPEAPAVDKPENAPEPAKTPSQTDEPLPETHPEASAQEPSATDRSPSPGPAGSDSGLPAAPDTAGALHTPAVPNQAADEPLPVPGQDADADMPAADAPAADTPNEEEADSSAQP